MFKHKGSNLGSFNLNSHFTHNDTSTADNGFRLAIGIFNYDEEIYDKLELYAAVWSADFTIDPPLDLFTEVELHSCTNEELDSFYPINESQKNEFKTLKSILKCFDHSKLKLAGNYHSSVIS